MKIKPFTIRVEQTVLDDLHERIRRTRWPDEIPDTGWTYGADLSYMKELTGYWLNRFDWRETEAQINSYPNFMTEEGEYRIHFMYVRSGAKNPFPLLLLHGWPDSFLGMMKLIPLLTRGEEPQFDLVIPSLPGYGFSQQPAVPGINIHLMADLFVNLMKELGYMKYGVHGGDFGSGAGTAMAIRYPENVAGLHVNNIEGYYKPFVPEGASLKEEEIRGEQEGDEWYEREGGYSHIQRTRPITLSYAMNDSPVGLCAWIVEKFFLWSDCNGDIESVFSKDELLSNVTLYWITETFHSSIRLYNETRKAPLHFTRNQSVKVPVGVARFHLEDPFPPRSYIERGYNIQHWSEFPVGGHFAASEQPEALATDIRAFFRDYYG